MEVILRETIDNLGRAGQVVKVADGYARNYLLPKKLAYLATPGNLKVIGFERESLLRKDPSRKVTPKTSNKFWTSLNSPFVAK